MKARYQDLEVAAWRNQSLLRDRGIVIEEAKGRREQYRSLGQASVVSDSVALEGSADLQTLPLEVDGGQKIVEARRTLLFAGLLQGRPSTPQPPRTSLSRPALSQPERQRAIGSHAGMMRTAMEEARANRQRVLFGAAGGPAAAVRAWCESRASNGPASRSSTPVVPRVLPSTPRGSQSPCQPHEPWRPLPRKSSSQGSDYSEDSAPAESGSGLFWRRIDKMEVDLMYHAVDLDAHRSFLDGMRDP